MYRNEPAEEEFTKLSEKKPLARVDVEVLFEDGTAKVAYRHNSQTLGHDIWIDRAGFRIMDKEVVAWRPITKTWKP